MFGSFFKNRLLSYYFFVLILFTITIIIFQYNRERNYRQTKFELVLDNVTGITHRFLEATNTYSGKGFEIVDSLINIIPVNDLRISLIDTTGDVLFDSYVEDYDIMENHAGRPEIKEALRENIGSSIRKSATTGKEYFYYARQFDDIIIRAAAEYTFEVQSFLRIDKLFIIVILALFIVVWTVLLIFNMRINKATLQLKQLVSRANKDREFSDLKFPRNELGLVGSQIVEIYKDLMARRNKLETEQDKIFRHLVTMEEGIAIYSEEGNLILSNDSYVHYANILSTKAVNLPEEVLETKALKPVRKFIKQKINSPGLDLFDLNSSKEIVLNRQGRYFLVRCNIYKDLSYEIILKDITRSEKNRVLKQELSSNIAHELRTPVTSIVGYLETVMTSGEMKEELRNQFLKRAHLQSERLAGLIEHISVINKLEEGSEYYHMETVIPANIVKDVVDSMQSRLEDSDISVNIDIPEEISLTGNRTLFHSIFQNLIENSIKYAGEDIDITISKYYEDETFYYFRYSNNGNSIPENHLNRLFERFYRVDEGRDRKSGGTGLGLAIVKHSVQFHKGQIAVKNLKNGGVEFQFTVSKRL